MGSKIPIDAKNISSIVTSSTYLNDNKQIKLPLSFNSFPYSNNYINLLNMKNNDYINLNGYLLSSGYYLCINYRMNENIKPNQITFHSFNNRAIFIKHVIVK